MKVDTNKKILFSIIGLPRSGTTIINNIFNSLDNGFSISEPHWAYLHYRNNLRFGKINKLVNNNWNKNIDNLIPTFNKILNNSNYDIGGFKETYNSKSRRKNYITNELINLYIFVFRNPVYMINSQIKEGNKSTINEMIKEYNIFSNFYNKTSINDINTVLINYDEFCKSNIISYLNYYFKSYFKVIGELEIKKSKFILGDNKAHISKKIQLPKNQTKFLNKNQIEKIKNNIHFNLW